MLSARFSWRMITFLRSDCVVLAGTVFSTGVVALPRCPGVGVSAGFVGAVVFVGDAVGEADAAGEAGAAALADGDGEGEAAVVSSLSEQAAAASRSAKARPSGASFHRFVAQPVIAHLAPEQVTS